MRTRAPRRSRPFGPPGPLSLLRLLLLLGAVLMAIYWLQRVGAAAGARSPLP